MRLKLFLLIFIIASNLNAVSIIGEGTGDTRVDAKKNALADLSNKISVEVKSDFRTYTSILGNDYKTNREKLVQISSNLPIISAKFEYFDGTRLTKSFSKLSSKDSLRGYITELNRIKKEIDSAYLSLKDISSDNIKHKILSEILNNIDKFNGYKIVAVMLEGKNLPTLQITSSQIKIQLLKLEKKVNSIELGAKLLSKNIDEKAVYISAPTTSISSQVTPFAKIIKDELSKYINASKNSKDAKYFYRGSYEILDGQIYLSMKLYDSSNNILKSNSIKFDEQAYANIKYKPNNKSFDEAINTELVKSGDLSVDIGFKGYNRAGGIDLVDGDTVDIVVKTNKPICYFLVGHTLHEDEKFSYLLPIGSGNSKFISYLTGDDVNRLITILQDVPISKPFGSENLQIFASTFKNKCELKVPDCKENEDGYCVIGYNPSKVVVKTRGLNLKKKKYKTQRAENNISWTSFKK